MSALGQKRTSYAAVQESALPPKADIGAAMQNVRLVPIADIQLLGKSEPAAYFYKLGLFEDGVRKSILHH